MSRDFTYIDDIINGIEKALEFNGKRKSYKHLIFNLGNNYPIELKKMISILESIIGKKAKKIMMPMQLGDVKKTYADIDESKKFLGYCPTTEIREGLINFVNWYNSYNR